MTCELLLPVLHIYLQFNDESMLVEIRNHKNVVDAMLMRITDKRIFNGFEYTVIEVNKKHEQSKEFMG